MAILQSQTGLTYEQMVEKMAEMQAQLDGMKRGKVSLKVTEKGGVSVYGLGRFPVTLYKGQWERLLGAKEQIEAFIKANEASLSVKAE